MLNRLKRREIVEHYLLFTYMRSIIRFPLYFKILTQLLTRYINVPTILKKKKCCQAEADSDDLYKVPGVCNLFYKLNAKFLVTTCWSITTINRQCLVLDSALGNNKVSPFKETKTRLPLYAPPTVATVWCSISSYQHIRRVAPYHTIWIERKSFLQQIYALRVHLGKSLIKIIVGLSVEAFLSYEQSNCHHRGFCLIYIV